MNEYAPEFSAVEKDKGRLGDKLKEALPELNNVKVHI